MKFQRNKEGYLECEYKGCTYSFVNDRWCLCANDVELDWRTTHTLNKLKFTIPVNNISRKKAEKEIKKLLKSYKTTIEFDFELYTKKERKLQLKLNKLLRQEKLKLIYSYEKI